MVIFVKNRYRRADVDDDDDDDVDDVDDDDVDDDDVDDDDDDDGDCDGDCDRDDGDPLRKMPQSPAGTYFAILCVADYLPMAMTKSAVMEVC